MNTGSLLGHTILTNGLMYIIISTYTGVPSVTGYVSISSSLNFIYDSRRKFVQKLVLL